MNALSVSFAMKAAVAVSTVTFAMCASAVEPIKITLANWADTQAVVYTAKYVLETKLQQPVTLTTADLGIQFQGIARGDVDLMLGAWLPVTHAAYYARFKNDMEDLGVIYSGAKIGWAVPDYVPESEVASIGDLNKPEVKSKLNSTIQGIEPGAGEMVASEKALKEYDLAGYNLIRASEAGMLTAVARAYQSKSWIVATVWSPHWLWQKYKMRYLKDPKGVLGGDEQIHGFSSKQFATKFPRANVFIRHFKLTLADVESIELDGNASNDWSAAAKKFVDSHPEKVQAWLQQ
ncbi:MULTISPECIES: glycine betaine ABC transporter substrate-binding protein [Caballeronia]|jgi:glycine betaine/proline transport system substrate-binding protein|uniref:Glycine/betaine ABC transporter substrate-binding protein n=2 Tax=Burkholderiaceae TaxID=119060 RepID=A0A656QKW8_9BURK|nr:MULTISPECIES: glycine betaine ABC transporter substrate-binding protein [Caballeronia]KDR28858.1 glycine/betaine ABC transporter substrate-binding protein [Caballeronia zhejiangensis]MDR5790872.1 glycine betaine ABC transporter substrate-binding protein [Caballeronia sp. LP003]